MTSPLSLLPPSSELPTQSEETLTRILDFLFEPTPALHPLVLPTVSSTKFDSYDDLVRVIRGQLNALAGRACSSSTDMDTLEAILAAHPRLGEKKVDSALSRAEQAQLNTGGDAAQAEADELAKLNAEYEARFPGLRYVVFVDGRGRPEIMQNMRDRIERGDDIAERAAAIQAICDIAADRAKKYRST